MNAFYINDKHLLAVSNSQTQSISYSPSPYYNNRPKPLDISLMVLHCISLPESCFGLPFIEQLFLGKLDCKADPSFAQLQGLEVSAHLLIRRDAQLIQFVPFDKRAWHAGVSQYQGRDNCNDFSIGIELEGDIYSPYTQQQYQCLNQVLAAIYKHYPAITSDSTVAHSHIAPGRKLDPGPYFDWGQLEKHRCNE